MKLPHLLFALLLALCLALFYAVFFLPPPEAATGQAHPTLSAMLASGPTPPSARLFGWIYGSLLITLEIALLLLGLGRHGRKPAVRAFFVAGGAAVLAAFSALVWADHAAAQAGADPGRLVGSLPPATAWMLYGLWPVAAVFLVWWVLRFREDIVTDEDLRVFEGLLAEKRGGEA